MHSSVGLSHQKILLGIPQNEKGELLCQEFEMAKFSLYLLEKPIQLKNSWLLKSVGGKIIRLGYKNQKRRKQMLNVK